MSGKKTEAKKEIGRWAQDEHERFMAGKILHLCSSCHIWKGLEKSRRNCWD